MNCATPVIQPGMASVGQVNPLKIKAGVEMTISSSVAFNWFGMATENNIPIIIDAKVSSKVNTSIGKLKISAVILKYGKYMATTNQMNGNMIKNGVAFNRIRYNADFFFATRLAK